MMAPESKHLAGELASYPMAGNQRSVQRKTSGRLVNDAARAPSA